MLVSKNRNPGSGGASQFSLFTHTSFLPQVFFFSFGFFPQPWHSSMAFGPFKYCHGGLIYSRNFSKSFFSSPWTASRLPHHKRVLDVYSDFADVFGSRVHIVIFEGMKERVMRAWFYFTQPIVPTCCSGLISGAALMCSTLRRLLTLIAGMCIWWCESWSGGAGKTLKKVIDLDALSSWECCPP